MSANCICGAPLEQGGLPRADNESFIIPFAGTVTFSSCPRCQIEMLNCEDFDGNLSFIVRNLAGEVLMEGQGFWAGVEIS